MFLGGIFVYLFEIDVILEVLPLPGFALLVVHSGERIHCVVVVILLQGPLLRVLP